MTDVLVKYWTNFAKYGTPSPPSQIEDDLPVWRTFSVDQVRPTNIQYWQTENYYAICSIGETSFNKKCAKN